ncbi:MAG: Ca(2+)/H(+) antiporter, partial [uncultured Rubrobacteraceae bacterium]
DGLLHEHLARLLHPGRPARNPDPGLSRTPPRPPPQARLHAARTGRPGRLRHHHGLRRPRRPVQLARRRDAPGRVPDQRPGVLLYAV